MLTLPGAEESRSYGTPALRVKGKLIARLRSEAEGGLAVRCAMDARDVLLNADPEAFYLTDHYLDYPMILVRLDKIEDDALRDVLEQAWRDVAPAKLVDSWDD
ncbi:MAG: MmcQ/YjbR family DNA-binding protein [Acidobacteriota bacterium]